MRIQRVVSRSGGKLALVSDNFNRANNASVVGSPQRGPAPTVDATWGINNNQLAPNAPSGEQWIIWDCGKTTFTVTATLAVAGTGINSIVFRSTGVRSQAYALRAASGVNWGFCFFNTAAWSGAQGGSANVAPTSGQIIRVDVTPSVMTLYINGVQKLQNFDNLYSGTKVGFVASDATIRWDDFSVT